MLQKSTDADEHTSLTMHSQMNPVTNYGSSEITHLLWIFDIVIYFDYGITWNRHINSSICMSIMHFSFFVQQFYISPLDI